MSNAPLFRASVLPRMMPLATALIAVIALSANAGSGPVMQGHGKPGVSGTGDDLVIDEVRVFPQDPRPERGEQVVISFRTNQPSAGTLSLFGRDGLLVRELVFEDHGDTAPKRLLWDCRDLDGALVPAEAYTLRIEARTAKGQRAVFDPLTTPAGETVAATDVRYLDASEQVAYRIDRDARVSVRSGITEGGPLLRTIVDWEPRLAGEQREPWDGLDPDGRVRVLALPGHRIEVQAVSLPPHSVLVQREAGPSWEAYSTALTDARPIRPLEQTQAPGPLGPLMPRLDPAPRFTMAIDSPQGHRQGIPVVSGRVGIRVALDPEIKRRIIEGRFEVVFFVDTRFETETEEGYSPSTLLWDSSKYPDGEHLLTVNLVTLSGRTATASLPVIVDNLQASDETSKAGPDPSGARHPRDRPTTPPSPPARQPIQDNAERNPSDESALPPR